MACNSVNIHSSLSTYEFYNVLKTNWYRKWYKTYSITDVLYQNETIVQYMWTITYLFNG